MGSSIWPWPEGVSPGTVSFSKQIQSTLCSYNWMRLPIPVIYCNSLPPMRESELQTQIWYGYPSYHLMWMPWISSTCSSFVSIWTSMWKVVAIKTGYRSIYALSILFFWSSSLSYSFPWTFSVTPWTIKFSTDISTWWFIWFSCSPCIFCTLAEWLLSSLSHPWSSWFCCK